MQYFNLSSPATKVSLTEAVLTGIQGSSGLFMPEYIPQLPASFFGEIGNMSLADMAFTVAKAMFGSDIKEDSLRNIVENTLSFSLPVKQLQGNTYVLELFHGPTLAFKDVGARFMAGLFEYLIEFNAVPDMHILVATSGDTGGAVANAFYKKKGIRVTILFPKGKVSPLQELQLTTLGGNISAIEVDGTFDDCQAMVKQAFADSSLHGKINLASANSINFARLFPQSFYYFHAYAQLGKLGKPLVVAVPSGNFGNLTAGLIAKRMGLPIRRFIAATNSNRIVPDYLQTGIYTPVPSVQTISNAMDVGNPSNFSRMLHLYNGSLAAMQQDLVGYHYSDEATLRCMRQVHGDTGYTLDPHGAVAYLALQQQLAQEADATGLFLETAHPAKFIDVVKDALGAYPPIPAALKSLEGKKADKHSIPSDYQLLKKYLLDL
jgi:threonine synthase